jgi:hypothetical protein
MLPEIYDELLHKLIRRTIKGQVHWKLSSKVDMFSVKFHKYSLSVTRGPNYIHFYILDDNDRGIDEFRITNTDMEWDKIAAFYNQIRIKSPDINNAIKAIIAELEMAKVIGLKDADSHSEVCQNIYNIGNRQLR